MDEPDKAATAPFYQALKQAFIQPGCPVCRLVTGSVDRYLDSILWEMVNDPALRDRLNLARGYCREHGWMLVRSGAALGVAILTKDVITTLLRELDASVTGHESETGRRSLRSVLGRGRTLEGIEQLAERLSLKIPCPACTHARSVEADCLSTLLEVNGDTAELRRLHGESDGLCLSHFRQGLGMASTSAGATSFVAAQRTVWQRLADELGEFIRKNDYRFRDEGFGAERDAWLRALQAVSGPKFYARGETPDPT